MQYGRISLSRLLWIQITILFVTPCITYYIAVTKNQVPAFPHTSITDSACPYPQNILFRFTMLTATSFLSLVFFVMFKWLKMQKQRTKYPGQISSWIYPFTQFALLCYGVTIGTIDTTGTGLLHLVCASIFFVVLFLMTVTLTLHLKDMKNWDSTIMTSESWFFKRLTCLYLSILWGYCVINILTATDDSSQQKWGNTLEWNDVFVNLLWLFSFRTDWKDIYLCIRGNQIGKMNLQLQMGQRDHL